MKQINKTFRLANEIEVNRLGFGLMRLTGQPGHFGPFPEWDAGISLLKQAQNMGVNFFDSARLYGPLWTDRMLGDALSSSTAVLATKGGLDKSPSNHLIIDGSRDTLLKQIDEALENLRTSQLTLFQLHRVDPKTPLVESVKALDEARLDGRIRHIGLSKVTKAQLQIALDIAPIASVQNRFNISDQADADLVQYSAQQGIAFIAYAPLAADPMQPGARLPVHLALRWLMQFSENIIAIPGTTSSIHLEQNYRIWNDLFN